MLRAFLTSAFKPDIEIEDVKDAGTGYFEIYHPILRRWVIVPADQVEFRETDIGDLL